MPTPPILMKAMFSLITIVVHLKYARLECAAPKRWSKYTTNNVNV